MIYLALTILSGLFLTGVAATCLYGVYIVVGFVVLGSRELVKWCWKEFKISCVKEWKDAVKFFRSF